MPRLLDGYVKRYQARHVAKDFHRQPNIDYADAFSLIVKPTIIRTILSLVVFEIDLYVN